MAGDVISSSEVVAGKVHFQKTSLAVTPSNVVAGVSTDEQRNYQIDYDIIAPRNTRKKLVGLRYFTTSCKE